MTKTKVMNWLQKNTMTLILVLVFAFFAWRTEGKILMPNNISNLIAQNAYVFILATGMLLCILTGGNIDLAVGSVVCFAGAVGALMMANGTNMWVAVVVMLCFVVGIVACVIYIALTLRTRFVRIKKGYAVEKWLPVIGRMVIISAVCLFFFTKLAQYKGIPSALIWVALVVAVYAYITSKTTVGRYLYAIGGNEKATKLSGIDTRKIYFFAYANMGLLAGLAGIMTIARMCSAQPTYGTSNEMDAISSSFIGGASAYGGVGTVPGVIIGAVLMGVINLGMSIMGIDQNYQKVVKGAVLLAAVIFDVMSKKNNK